MSTRLFGFEEPAEIPHWLKQGIPRTRSLPQNLVGKELTAAPNPSGYRLPDGILMFAFEIFRPHMVRRR